MDIWICTNTHQSKEHKEQLDDISVGHRVQASKESVYYCHSCRYHHRIDKWQLKDFANHCPWNISQSISQLKRVIEADSV